MLELSEIVNLARFSVKPKFIYNVSLTFLTKCPEPNFFIIFFLIQFNFINSVSSFLASRKNVESIAVAMMRMPVVRAKVCTIFKTYIFNLFQLI